jgi:hypothetical protein
MRVYYRIDNPTTMERLIFTYSHHDDWKSWLVALAHGSSTGFLCTLEDRFRKYDASNPMTFRHSVNAVFTLIPRYQVADQDSMRLQSAYRAFLFQILEDAVEKGDSRITWTSLCRVLSSVLLLATGLDIGSMIFQSELVMVLRSLSAIELPDFGFLADGNYNLKLFSYRRPGSVSPIYNYSWCTQISYSYRY